MAHCFVCDRQAEANTPMGRVCQAHAEEFYQGLLRAGVEAHRFRQIAEAEPSVKAAASGQCDCGRVFVLPSASSRRRFCPTCVSELVGAAQRRRRAREAIAALPAAV